MDLTDLLTGGVGGEFIRRNKPANLDMDRISEIVLEMKAEMSEAIDIPDQQRVWEARVRSIVDFDALCWQALQVGFQIWNIENGRDLAELKASGDRYTAFIATLQAFYDGFLQGAEFEKRGGHRA